jgi:NAD dependent epimerase/dehydratase family enzyme
LPNVPAFVLKIVMGEMAIIVLTGLRVSSDKIEKTGFEFKYKSLQLALKDCLTK